MAKTEDKFLAISAGGKKHFWTCSTKAWLNGVIDLGDTILDLLK